MVEEKRLEERKIGNIALRYRTKAYNGKLTFVGVLVRYYDTVRLNWEDSTSERYLSDYGIRLLKALPHNKALADYVKNDIAEILKKLNDKENESHYLHLIKHVFDAAEEHGICENIFAAEFEKTNEKESDKDKENRLIKTRKSFSLSEEKKLLDYFGKVLCDKAASGIDICVMLMMFLGLRNQEAAGLTFDAVKQLGQSKYYGIYIFQKVSSREHEARIGGKTKNAFRIIPAFDFLHRFIEERKAYILQQIKGEEAEIDIGTLPIGCKEGEYSAFCNPDDIREYAKELFKRLGISQNTVEESKMEIRRLLLVGVDIEEEDPRAYLFRKNYGTHLGAMDFIAEEIQYLIGHDVEDDIIERNDFVNEDRMLNMAERMQQHPYCIWYDGVKDDKIIEFGNDGDCETGIIISANEPGDNIIIDMESNVISEIGVMQGYKTEADKYTDTVDIREIIRSLYQYSDVSGSHEKS